MPQHRRSLLLAFLLALPLAVPAAPAATDELRALVRTGEIDRAVAVADRLVERLRSDADAWWWAGRAYGMKALRASLLAKPKWAGRTREAFERAVALDGTHLDARLDLMGYYLAAPSMLGGGTDKAAQQAEAIGRIDPAMGKFAQARLASADDQSARAGALLEEALLLDPDALRVRSALAQRAQAAEDWATVRALWNAQLARGAHEASAHYQLGRAAAVSGEQLEEGLQSMDRFIAAGEVPEDLTLAAAHWRRGQILAALGRTDEARAALQLALEDPFVGAEARKDLARIDAG